MKKVKYIHFGEKLKALRVYRKIDVKKLATLIGRPPGYIEELESHSSWDKLDVRFNDIAGLQKVLEIGPDYFFNDWSLENQLKVEKMMVDPEFKDMKRRLDALPKEFQQYWKALLEKMASNN